jgi:hypothetical protein
MIQVLISPQSLLETGIKVEKVDDLRLFKFTDDLQTQLEALLDKNQLGNLTPNEQTELENIQELDRFFTYLNSLIMINLDQALDIVMQLPREQQETLLDIVRHRHIEQRRDEIAQDAQRSIEEFQSGQYQPMAIEQVLEDT